MKFKLAPFIFLIACSHASYKPEVPDGSDQGIIFNGGGLVFSIPASHPLDKMKLSFLGIRDGDKLHLRLRFIRKSAYDPGDPEKINIKDLGIRIEGHGPDLLPVKTRANQKAKPWIILTGDARQAVELVYQIPLVKGQKAEFAYFDFRWRIQYAKGKFEAQTVRFDRQYTKGNLSAVPYQDPDFGQYNEMDDGGWYPAGTGWW